MKQNAKLINAETGQVLLQSLEIANNPWTRFLGLMFRQSTPPDYGMLIQPCRSIHTMWMQMPIDVTFLSKDNVVLGCRSNIRPWRIVIAPRGTVRVLETTAGQVILTIGTKLSIQVG